MRTVAQRNMPPRFLSLSFSIYVLHGQACGLRGMVDAGCATDARAHEMAERARNVPWRLRRVPRPARSTDTRVRE